MKVNTYQMQKTTQIDEFYSFNCWLVAVFERICRNMLERGFKFALKSLCGFFFTEK